MDTLPATSDSLDRRRRLLPTTALLSFAASIVAVVVIALVSYSSLENATINADRVTRTISALREIEAALSDAKDAETGQRGFLLTGTESYLDPYTNGRSAVFGELDALQKALADNPEQIARLIQLRQAVTDKVDELALSISLKRDGNGDAALALVKTNRGKLAMDHIRALAAKIGEVEREALAERQQQWREAAATSFRVVSVGSLALIVLIAIAAWLMARDFRARESEAWVRNGLMRLGNRLRGEKRIERLGDEIIEFLCRYLGAPVGAIYATDGDAGFRRLASFGLSAQAADAIANGPSRGLIDQTLKDGRLVHLTGLPEGYWQIASGTGAGRARELIIAPAMTEGNVQAVIELGFLTPTLQSDRELLDRASEALAIALRSARDRTRLESLLEETQRQAEELQAQQEELRVSNEELEEQGRVLKESQAQLETQQAELEQTNSHLEEQTQMLATQRDDLEQAQNVLGAKAEELQRANVYKSEFLANMSHELRTPLNSTLILARLLSENKQGNLTDEQVKFAETISSAGNDLLALINDILDLAKIEAGKIDLDIESMPVAKAMDGLTRVFAPLAQDKGIEFSVLVDDDAPKVVVTDMQRHAQILRNLLSNALKFTEKGSIALRVMRAGDDGVMFSVRDSGIGIAPEHQEFIFEAFRQADGSTHRKYGGTGLGLAISRDLARRLGGDITLQSTLGAGSTFTLRLPVTYAEPVPQVDPAIAAAVAPPAAPASAAATPAPAPRAAAPRAPAPPPGAIEDDREQLAPGARVILVIEDDTRFAMVLRDMAREMGFRVIAAHSANDGLQAAAHFRPSAILLDMNLPDHSGLGVLDQLKRNPLTRHIPVHVISVADYSQEARGLGAVGYALKPVKREEIVEALQKLEARFSQSLRRVLVVEDDARQGESIQALLATPDIEIRLVSRAADALAELERTTFDCMVMDLNLPDMTGYALLERMAQKDDVAFPPVIVYTGRSITREEEQSLRRFSKSIIIKDARSPERLLDEVTLFLHQVESTLPPASQRLLREVRNRDEAVEGRRILVVEDDVRNIFALSSVLEQKGAKIEIARNGREAIAALERAERGEAAAIDLVLMDIMMPEMDGYEATMQIRKRPEWKRLPIIALTAKAMRDDQEKCLSVGANDYIAKPLDVERLLSLIRVWMPKR